MVEMSPAGIRERYKSAFLKGLATILPTVLTVYILLFTYNFVDENIATPLNAAIRTQLKTGPGREIAVRLLHVDPTLLEEGAQKEFSAAVDESYPTWVGFVGAIVICLVVGFFIASFLGRRVWAVIEGSFMKMPVVKAIYPSAKQITEFFIKDDTSKSQFSRVGFVPFPQEGCWSVGFVMADGYHELDRLHARRHLSVFVPMAPTPVTGFVVLVPEDRFHAVDMSVDEAFKYYVTAGMVVPERHRVRPGVPGPEEAEVVVLEEPRREGQQPGGGRAQAPEGGDAPAAGPEVESRAAEPGPGAPPETTPPAGGAAPEPPERADETAPPQRP